MKEDIVYQAKAEEIVIPENRQRKTFKKREANELRDSIEDFGQKQPGVCRVVDGKFVLVFGQRRLIACQELNIPFKYLIEAEIDPVRLKEIELIENTHRVDLDFKELAEAIDELHQLKQQQKGEAKSGALSSGHGVRDTATLLGLSPTKVQEEIEIARFSELPEVTNAKNRAEALTIIKRLKQEFQRGEMLRRAREAAEINNGEHSGDSKDINTAWTNSGGTPQDIESSGENYEPKDISTSVSYFSKLVKTGRMEEELESFENGMFDIVCFDPPWGVEYDKVQEKSGKNTEFEDTMEGFVTNISDWLDLLWKKMAENSHLYLFFGIVNYEFVYNTLEKTGFETNRMPLIWYKQGAHRTRNPDIWPGRSYEPIAYARKGKKPLVRKGMPDIIITPAPWGKLKQNHPAAKHPDIYLDLLRRSAVPGDVVLDPMCGSGMFGVAAEVLRPTHQLRWTMIEKEEVFTDLAIMNVIKGYHQIVTVERTQEQFHSQPEELPDNYKGLEVGSDMWKRYWKAHPEEQEEMIEWRNNEGLRQ